LRSTFARWDSIVFSDGCRISAICTFVCASVISFTTSSSRGVSGTAGPSAPSAINWRMIERSAALVKNASPRPTARTAATRSWSASRVST